MTNLARAPSKALSTDVLGTLEELAQQSVPENTRRTYESAQRRFREWCSAHGRKALPASAETLCIYIGHLASEKGRSGQKKRLSTVQVALAAIHAMHGEAKEHSERGDFRVKKLLRGLGHQQADQPKKKKKAATDQILAKLVKGQPRTLLGVRARRILVVGFSLCVRRSELVALNVEDIEWRLPKGMIATIIKDKTNKTGVGVPVEVFANSPEHKFMCPVRALRYWLKVSGVSSGPIFREIYEDDSIGAEALDPQVPCDVVKHACELAGLNPKPWGAHSLRAGFITSAAERGVPLHVIMQTSRHKSADIARGYVRPAELLREGAGKGLLDFDVGE